METENKNIENKDGDNKNTYSGYEGGSSRERITTGAFIMVIGALFLAHQVGADIPRWVFSWPMILVAVGLYIGVRHSFRNWAWLAPFTVGVVFLADRILDMSMMQYFWPIVIIAIGLGMMLKPRRRNHDWPRKDWSNARWKQHAERWKDSSTTWNDPNAPTEHIQGDFIDSVAIFGSSKKNILSKNFRGGDTVCFFGGTELNMSQADITGPIKLDVVQVFGGTKLIVPPHWRIQTEDMVSIFGGIDDKRKPLPGQVYDPSKVLIFEGTCIFGGIEIKSY